MATMIAWSAPPAPPTSLLSTSVSVSLPVPSSSPSVASTVAPATSTVAPATSTVAPAASLVASTAATTTVAASVKTSVGTKTKSKGTSSKKKKEEEKKPSRTATSKKMVAAPLPPVGDAGDAVVVIDDDEDDDEKKAQRDETGKTAADDDDAGRKRRYVMTALLNVDHALGAPSVEMADAVLGGVSAAVIDGLVAAIRRARSAGEAVVKTKSCGKCYVCVGPRVDLDFEPAAYPPCRRVELAVVGANKWCGAHVLVVGFKLQVQIDESVASPPPSRSRSRKSKSTLPSSSLSASASSAKLKKALAPISHDRLRLRTTDDTYAKLARDAATKSKRSRKSGDSKNGGGGGGSTPIVTALETAAAVELAANDPAAAAAALRGYPFYVCRGPNRGFPVRVTGVFETAFEIVAVHDVATDSVIAVDLFELKHIGVIFHYKQLTVPMRAPAAGVDQLGVWSQRVAKKMKTKKSRYGTSTLEFVSRYRRHKSGGGDDDSLGIGDSESGGAGGDADDEQEGGGGGGDETVDKEDGGDDDATVGDTAAHTKATKKTKSKRARTESREKKKKKKSMKKKKSKKSDSSGGDGDDGDGGEEAEVEMESDDDDEEKAKAASDDDHSVLDDSGDSDYDPDSDAEGGAKKSKKKRSKKARAAGTGKSQKKRRRIVGDDDASGRNDTGGSGSGGGDGDGEGKREKEAETDASVAAADESEETPNTDGGDEATAAVDTSPDDESGGTGDGDGDGKEEKTKSGKAASRMSAELLEKAQHEQNKFHMTLIVERMVANPAATLEYSPVGVPVRIEFEDKAATAQSAAVWVALDRTATDAIVKAWPLAAGITYHANQNRYLAVAYPVAPGTEWAFSVADVETYGSVGESAGRGGGSARSDQKASKNVATFSASSASASAVKPASAASTKDGQVYIAIQFNLSTGVSRRLRLAPLGAVAHSPSGSSSSSYSATSSSLPTSSSSSSSSSSPSPSTKTPHLPSAWTPTTLERHGLGPLAETLGLRAISKLAPFHKLASLRPRPDGSLRRLFADANNYEPTAVRVDADVSVNGKSACRKTTKDARIFARQFESERERRRAAQSLLVKSTGGSSSGSYHFTLPPAQERRIDCDSPNLMYAAMARFVTHLFVSAMQLPPCNQMPHVWLTHEFEIVSITAILDAAHEMRYQQQIDTQRLAHEDRGLVWPGADERWLFHGTAYAASIAVTREGFRAAYNYKSMYGQGNYFSTTASYSDGYAQPDPTTGLQVMFVARVLVNGMTPTNAQELFPGWHMKSPRGVWLPADSQRGLSAVPRVVGCNETVPPEIIVCAEDASSVPHWRIVYRKRPRP